jgi:hypothetical protein
MRAPLHTNPSGMLGLDAQLRMLSLNRETTNVCETICSG